MLAELFSLLLDASDTIEEMKIRENQRRECICLNLCHGKWDEQMQAWTIVPGGIDGRKPGTYDSENGRCIDDKIEE